MLAEINRRGQYTPYIPVQYEDFMICNSEEIINNKEMKLHNKLNLLTHRAKVADQPELIIILEYAKSNFEEIKGPHRTEFRHLCKMIDWALYKKTTN